VELDRPRPSLTPEINMTRQPSAAFGALDTPERLTSDEIDVRARELLEQLTFDEKLGLMDGDLPFWQGLAKMSAPQGYSRQFWVAGAVPRLGIPGIRFVDGPRGVVMDGATTFPVSMARGATFDPDLEVRVGEVIGREIRALGGNFFGGVCINLLRHPAWGRAQESYGEDSHHLGIMGAALATGVQNHVMACVKHFALNSMENARQDVDVTADERTLHEVYLAHFKRVVDAGVASVMTAYNSVSGEWAGQNRALIADILKDIWGFAGFTITDFIVGMRDAKTAALAGQDVEMPFATIYAQHLKELVERDEVPASRIDDAALRVLRQQVRFGQGRDAAAYPRSVVGSQAHRAVAREAAEKSIVLLKNEGALLPLAKGRTLAVIGALAARPNTGDGGSSMTHPDHVVTPLEGLTAALGSDALIHDDGTDARRAASVAASANTALVVVGYTHADEGEYIPPNQLQPHAALFPPPGPGEEALADKLINGMSDGGFSPGGDRLSLRLRPEDEALIAVVAAANPRTIVAVMAGSAVIMEAWRHSVPAILMLWYPGQEGGHALADILLGEVNPSGRLPCTFPASADHLPFFDRAATAISYDLWHGYRKLLRDGNQPAFPFGFGLSYTTFAHSNLALAADTLSPGDTLGVTVDVTNTGQVAGDDVVQLYVAVHGSEVERAPRELKAFARVHLAPGERRTVHLSVPASELAWFDESRGWVIEPTECEALVAHHAHDGTPLSAAFRITD
jgi:beta-glucosidase